VEHLDQRIIIFNILLSDYVILGDIDLTGHTHLKLEVGEEEETLPDIFQPLKLLDHLEDTSVSELQLINKTPIVNFIGKVLHLADEDVKRTIMVIFKDILLIGKNFHYEITNRHLALIMIELLDFYHQNNEDAMTDFHIH